MHITSLQLSSYRSWPYLQLDLERGTTIFVGRNGRGKTNIVEAIGVLSSLRSHRTHSYEPLFRHGADEAKLSAVVRHQQRELQIALSLNKGRRTVGYINGDKCSSPSDMSGILRSVIFAPEDLSLIKGDPATRRSFIDSLCSMRRPAYAALKSEYDKIVKQRGSLLKSIASQRAAAELRETLTVWDSRLAAVGAEIMMHRHHAIGELNPHVEQMYKTIASDTKTASLAYLPQVPVIDSVMPNSVDECENLILIELARQHAAECARGMVLVGPHRDDIAIELGGNLTKNYASHGETWSTVLALKLATAQLHREDGMEPVIILDDVFAELDTTRRNNLLDAIASAEQIFITSAVEEDIPSRCDGHIFHIDIEVENQHGTELLTSQIIS